MGTSLDPFTSELQRLARQAGLDVTRLAVESAISPILARMPAITYRGYLRQSVAHSALIAGLRS